MQGQRKTIRDCQLEIVCNTAKELSVAADEARAKRTPMLVNRKLFAGKSARQIAALGRNPHAKCLFLFGRKTHAELIQILDEARAKNARRCL